MSILVDVLKTMNSEFQGGIKPAPGGHRVKCVNCIREGKKPKDQKMYFLEKTGSLVVYCHRCGYSKSFMNFLKDFFPHMVHNLGEAVLEHVSEQNRQNSTFRYRNTGYQRSTRSIADQHFADQMWLDFQELEELPGCDRLDYLKRSHKAVRYAEWRQIPYSMLKYLYYVSDFSALAKRYGYDTSKWMVEDRLLIPFWNWDKQLTHIQGRSFLEETNLRYLTLDVMKDQTKIWGRHRIDLTKPVFITEGPIDGFFVPNCGSTAGSKISESDLREAFPGVEPKNIIMIFDNEPEKEEIRAEMEKKIREGFSILLWDRSRFREKDINKMVMDGNPNYQMDVLWSMVYNGPEALARFYDWS